MGELKSLLQESMAPFSKSDFLETLNAGITFPELRKERDYYIDNFRVLYNMVITYSTDFLEYYDYLQEGCETVNVPALEHKIGQDMSLKQLYINRMPFQLGIQIDAEISMRKKKSFKKFPVAEQLKQYLFEFLGTFYAKCKEPFEQSRFLRSIGHSKHGVGIRLGEQPTANRLNHLEDPDGKLILDPPNSGSVRESYYESTRADPEFEESSITEETITEEDQDEHYDHVDSTDLILQMQDKPMRRPPPPAPAQGQKIKPHVITNNACYRKLYQGECKDTLCKKEHSASALLELAKTQQETLMRRVKEIETAHKIPSGKLFHIVSQDTELHTLSPLPYIKCIHRRGVLHVGSVDIHITALFDSGATCRSYISKAFVDEHRGSLSRYLQHVNAKVRLGDGQAEKSVDEVLKLPVSFYKEDGTRLTGVISMDVFDTTLQCIIGLPDIIITFLDIFMEMLLAAKRAILGDEETHSITSHLNAISKWDHQTARVEMLHDQPWSKLYEEAEEDDAPIPCNFALPLEHMEKGREKLIEEFRASFRDHIEEEFRTSTNIENLLMEKSQVFIPDGTWTGISGVDEVVIETTEDLPTSLTPKAAFINPLLFETAKKEFNRLLGYFYEPSTSAIQSRLVIAPKKTAPFIRFCGNYVEINRYIIYRNHYTPNVRLEIDKIQSYKFFADLDLANSFHQLRLAKESRKLLALATKWGVVQPKFLPEGVSIATSELQKVVTIIFKSCIDEGWIIVIYDNILVLAQTHQDLYQKLEIVFDLCIQRNLVLKFGKTFIGYTKANFFGYEVSHQSFCISEERKSAITQIPFPGDAKNKKKAMQSFLGATNFIAPFVPDYAKAAAPLQQMTHNDFDWNETSWTIDYRNVFIDFKSMLIHSMTSLFYPNYELTWYLRVDASDVGGGGVLLQDTGDGEQPLQPIAFIAHKFSDAAQRWTVIEKEGFMIYFCVMKLSYYLYCKSFTLQTDHRNLLWMEQSPVPKIMRWLIFLQAFCFVVEHIPGKHNLVADYFSRIPYMAMLLALTKEDLFKKVHGGRRGHPGARETWIRLRDEHPGHCLSYKDIVTFIHTCSTCQKTRLGMSPSLPDVVRHLLPPRFQIVIGIDTLTISEDSQGYKYIIVTHNMTTKLSKLFPTRDKSAETTAIALFLYCCSYGIPDAVRSDQGSDFMSDVVQKTFKWLGIDHIPSIVDRHESNGVEPTNREIIRHLSAIVQDERVAHK